MADKLLHSLYLLLGEIGEIVLHGFQVRHIAQQRGRIYEILVYLIEIRQYDIPPEDEFVQRLGHHAGGTTQRVVAVVQIEQQPHLRSGLLPGHGIETVLDGIHRRRDDRSSRILDTFAQMSLEEHHRASVGKYETAARQASAVALVIMLRHLAEKGSYAVHLILCQSHPIAHPGRGALSWSGVLLHGPVLRRMSPPAHEVCPVRPGE